MGVPVKDKKLIDISPKDPMYEGNREHYFAVGQSAVSCIQAAMTAAGKKQVRAILDYASGYGRVLRALKSAFPAADLTACDLTPDAVDYCAGAFGAHPVLASEDPAKVRLNSRFDLIWCGTLLTNLDAPLWTGLLDLLQSRLTVDGLLVFTTHGPHVARQLRANGGNYGLDEQSVASLLHGYDSVGFGYVDYPAPLLAEIGMQKYGFSVAKPSWVGRQIESMPGMRLIAYTERAWDNHQDSIACANA